MFPVLIVFSLSFLVLAILILHKIWEIKRGHTFLSKAVLPKSDSLLKKHIEIHKEVFVGGSKRGFKFVSSLTKESVKHVLLVSAHYLQGKLNTIIHKVKGTTFKHKSGVSFFLKRMEGYKEESVKHNVSENDNTVAKNESGENVKKL